MPPLVRKLSDSTAEEAKARLSNEPRSVADADAMAALQAQLEQLNAAERGSAQRPKRGRGGEPGRGAGEAASQAEAEEAEAAWERRATEEVCRPRRLPARLTAHLASGQAD